MAGDLDGASALLHQLSAASGPLPPAELAAALHLAPERMAVLLEALQDMDPQLICQDETGIRLQRPLNLLNADYLHRHSSRGRVDLVAETGSTNSLMLEHCANAVSGDVIIAEIQYRGRGRRGREWQGSIGRQLTLSMAWGFLQLESITGLSVAVGTALVSALHSLGFRGVMLKWPNDLCLAGSKCGGIIVETRASGRGLFSVIGVGLNVFAWPQVPGEEQPGFAALENDLGARNCEHLERNFLAASLINAMRTALRGFEERGFGAFAGDLERFDFLRGREVTVSTGERQVRGQVLGIGENGLLLVRSGTRTLSLRSGHVTSYS